MSTRSHNQFFPSETEPELAAWQSGGAWRVGELPGAVQVQPIWRKLPPVERMVERNAALGACGVEVHVICAATGTLYSEATRRLQFELGQERFSPWHHTVDVAEGPESGLHTHHDVPIEAVPGLVEWFHAQEAAGVRRRDMRLSGAALREALPDVDPAIEFIRIVYDLPGLVEYIRCQPRIELAKVSDHRRHIPYADQLAAAEIWCAAKISPGKKRRAVMTWIAAPCSLEVITERRERRAAAGLEAERLEAVRLEAERRAKWKLLRDLARLNRLRFPELAAPRLNGTVSTPRRRAAPHIHMPRRWPVPGLPVTSRRVRLVGHARPPPKR